MISRYVASLVIILGLCANATSADSNLPARGGKDQPERGRRGRQLPPQVEFPGAEKLYCDDRIVAVGESMGEVFDRCGEPTWRQQLHDVSVLDPTVDLSGLEPFVTEEWIYNLGAQRLIRFLRFRDGKLVSIRTGGYGYDGPMYSVACKNGKGFRLRASKLEVLFTCGEPATAVYGGVAAPPEARRQFTLESDEWRYNFGPDSFVYVLRFRKGRLVDIKTEGYGK